MPSYREQYDRLKRWYDRFASLDRGREHNISSDKYLDEIHAFFLICYHLKDWIKNDGAVPTAARQAVESYIRGDRSLRLCADICNSLKHLRLDRPRSGESPAFGNVHYGLGIGPGIPVTISLKCEVDTASGPEDAFKLATGCVTAWDAFLNAHHL